jgi:hypothetical protein
VGLGLVKSHITSVDEATPSNMFILNSLNLLIYININYIYIYMYMYIRCWGNSVSIVSD